jgi:hypothetical protein
MARGTDNKGGSAIYLRIADGMVVEQVEEGKEGAISRTTKPSDEHPNGRTVWERRDKFVEGVVISMFRKEREYKGEVMNSLAIRLKDGGEVYQIDLNEGNRYWSSFMLRLPNLDLSKSVRLLPYDFTDKEGRRVVGMNLMQGSDKVQPKWTKDSPGDLPQGRKVRVNGKDVWDFEDRDQYLLKVMQSIASKLQAADTAIEGGKDEPVVVSDEDDDGLPF